MCKSKSTSRLALGPWLTLLTVARATCDVENFMIFLVLYTIYTIIPYTNATPATDAARSPSKRLFPLVTLSIFPRTPLDYPPYTAPLYTRQLLLYLILVLRHRYALGSIFFLAKKERSKKNRQTSKEEERKEEDRHHKYDYMTGSNTSLQCNSVCHSFANCTTSFDLISYLISFYVFLLL